MRTTAAAPHHHPLRAAWLPFALALTALCLGACGTAEGGGDAGRSATPSPTVRPADFLVSADDLPAGWRDSNSQGLDFRVTVCGVDLEPEPPLRATSIRFSQGPVGPFLEQHARVYAGDSPRRVVAALSAALPTCTRYDARGTNPQSRTASFTVEPLEVAGAPEGSVAWRQTSRGELPITSDVLLLPRGNALVALTSYALRAEPDPAVLEAAVAAVPAR